MIGLYLVTVRCQPHDAKTREPRGNAYNFVGRVNAASRSQAMTLGAAAARSAHGRGDTFVTAKTTSAVKIA